MQDDAFVVVFPSAAGAARMPALARNIKSWLRLRGQPFESARRDCGVLVVKARDPVFASTAIGQLFGVSRVAISRRTGVSLGQIVESTARLGGSLLLRGDRFLVKVEGRTMGFVPADAELAATSAIIEKSGSAPGTESSHDKVLRVHVTRENAYVSIFEDEGLGGVPNRTRDPAVCPVYGALSALSCIEAARRGFRTRVVVPYRTEADIASTAKALARAVPSMMGGAEIHFCRVPVPPAELDHAAALLCAHAAPELGAARACLPLSAPQHTQELVDAACGAVSGAGLVPHLPIDCREDDLAAMAARFGLSPPAVRAGRPRRSSWRGAAAAWKARRTVSVAPGPNVLHDMLDGLGKGARRKA